MKVENRELPGMIGEWVEKGLSFVICAAIALVLHVSDGTGENQGWFLYSLVAVLTLYVIGRLAFLGYVYVHKSREELGMRRSLECGLLIIFYAYLLVDMSGGQQSALRPLIYLSLAAVTTFTQRSVILAVIASAVVLEFSQPLIDGRLSGEIWVVASHIGMMIAFVLLYPIARSIGGGIEHSKASSHVKQWIGDIRQEAERFRLVEATRPESVDADHDRKHDLSSYFEIHGVIQDIIQMLAMSLDVYTGVVLWYDPAKKTLKVVEAVSASNTLTSQEFSSDEGVLHSVISKQASIKVVVTQWATNPIGYYHRKEPIYSLCAVPIVSDDVILGVLAVDRCEEIEFTAEDLEVVKLAANQIRRATVNEHLLRSLDKSQNEYYHLTKASRALARTLSESEVLEVALEATHAIAPFDLGVIVMMHELGQGYEIVANWPQDLGMKNLQFGGTQNLVDWVIRKNQSLVYHDFLSLPKRPVIFMSDEKLSNLASLLVVPLNVQAHTCGAFVLSSARENFFTDDLQHIFEIISNQLAVSLENAQMYAKVEQMAITDGLTGLYNKRYFNERLEELVSRAERYGQKLALLIMDIDHFKSVNDTYGHPVGDFVLKEVAALLNESMRKTDLVARWGGEEFVVLLDSTGAESAMQKANQLREQASELSFETELGNFSVQISFGVTIFPFDTRKTDEMVEKADQALYHSKKNGRNQVTLFRDL